MDISYWASSGNSWDHILAGCRHAEATGWDGIWVPDHFMPNAEGYGPEEKAPDDPELEPVHEAWSLLAALAALVPRVRLGAMVAGITYRHPALLANIACTVDHISGGRLVLGIGAGWQENEHARYGMALGSPGERSDRFEEACAVLTSLLSQPRTTFAGRYFSLDGAPCEPKPVQRSLPIMIGGGGERRTLATVARWADEWNVWGVPDDLRAKIAVLDRHCDEIGRDPATIRRSAAALLVICDDEATSARLRSGMAHRGGLVGTVGELRDRVADYAAAGVDELVVPDFTMDPTNRDDTLDRFRIEVMGR